MSIEVNCLCGKIKIAIEADPLSQLYCHCDDCQAVSGGAYVGLSLYPSEAVKIVEGEPTVWAYKSTPRSRCKDCGTILFNAPKAAPFKGVNSNLLPKGSFKPLYHVQCKHAVLPVSDDLPHYKGFPAAFGGSDETEDW